jgi:hypothetical protein
MNKILKNFNILILIERLRNSAPLEFLNEEDLNSAFCCAAVGV